MDACDLICQIQVCVYSGDSSAAEKEIKIHVWGQIFAFHLLSKRLDYSSKIILEAIEL